MKLFARLFDKPRPSPPTLPERIAILQAGSPDIIVDTALHAGEENLRVAAIQKLPDGEVLRGLAGFGASTAGTASASSPAVERAARTRMAQLIDEGAIDFPAYCDRARSQPDMLSVAALCKDADRLPQALASIQDPAQIAQLVVESPSSRLRQLAAESIRDPAQLRQLIPQVRNKDKNVYRILKQKCDVLNAEERKQERSATRSLGFAPRWNGTAIAVTTRNTRRCSSTTKPAGFPCPSRRPRISTSARVPPSNAAGKSSTRIFSSWRVKRPQRQRFSRLLNSRNWRNRRLARLPPNRLKRRRARSKKPRQFATRRRSSARNSGRRRNSCFVRSAA